MWDLTTALELSNKGESGKFSLGKIETIKFTVYIPSIPDVVVPNTGSNVAWLRIP